MNLPAILIWDWNGTLQDDVCAAVAGTNALLQDQGDAPISLDHYRETFSFPARSSYAKLGIHATDENWDALCARFFSVFVSHPGVGLFPGAAEALAAVANAGVANAIVTSSEETAVKRAAEKYGISGFFTAIRGQSDAAAGSKIGLALGLFSELGISPDQALVVGDTGHDKEVADAIGCPCVLVSSGYESSRRLSGRGVPVLASIAEIPSFLGIDG